MPNSIQQQGDTKFHIAGDYLAIISKIDVLEALHSRDKPTTLPLRENEHLLLALLFHL